MNDVNIVLLTIDALRFDHCGFNGYHRDVTPNIDKLVNKGVKFTNMYATGPCTPPSFCSIFTGTFPFDKGGYSPLPSQKTTIAEVMKNAGYYTAGFHSNPLISHFFNYHRGFMKYFDSMTTENISPVKKKILNFFESDGTKSNVLLNQLQNLPIPKKLQTTIKNLFYSTFLGRKVKYYIPANKITRMTINWLKSKFIFKKKSENLKEKTNKTSQVKNRPSKKKSQLMKKPLFLWVHYMDTHDPFIPSDYKNLKKIKSPISKKEFEHNLSYPEYTDILKENDKKRKLIDFYDAEIIDVDEKINKLVNYFKELDLYKNTIFILTSDHGEEFNDHGDYGHRAHLYDELVHVPFAIFGGPIEEGKFNLLKPGTTIKNLLSLIQLPSTILTLARIKNEGHFDAESIFKSLSSQSSRENQAQAKGNQRGKERSHVMSCTFHKGIVTRFNQSTDPTIKKMACIRTRKYKYIFDTETNKKELYNVIDDPKEMNDIANKEMNLVNTFHELCITYIKGRGHLIKKPKSRILESKEIDKIKAISKKLKMKI
ncbi:MAG: sulfatase [Promethearchaeota archaeon]